MELNLAHPIQHAENSVRRWGGQVSDYTALHEWFDESKGHYADVRHRALRHHSEGIFLCERIFGRTVKNSDGKEVPVRYLGEQHIREDLGRIPSVQDWLECIQLQPWMRGMRLQEVSSVKVEES